MRKNKAQVTIFILMGLILLLAFSFFFLFESETSLEIESISDLPFEFDSVKFYIDECAKDAAVSGIYLLASKGGYIYEYGKVLNTENVGVAYHLEFENDISLEEKFMENELSKFVERSLEICILDFENSNEFVFVFGEADAETNIKENNILIDVNYPITVSKDNSKLTISDFKEDIPIRLGHILDIKNDIISNIKNNNFIDLDYLSSLGVEVNLLPYDKNNLVYAIFDEESEVGNVPFNFNFAARILGNSPPELEFVPDFVLTKNKQFFHDLRATDPDNDNLRFFTDDALLNMNPNTGLFSFTPLVGGDYEVEVCVEDPFLARDCENLKFMIENA